MPRPAPRNRNTTSRLRAPTENLVDVWMGRLLISSCRIALRGRQRGICTVALFGISKQDGRAYLLGEAVIHQWNTLSASVCSHISTDVGEPLRMLRRMGAKWPAGRWSIRRCGRSLSRQVYARARERATSLAWGSWGMNLGEVGMFEPYQRSEIRDRRLEVEVVLAISHTRSALSCETRPWEDALCGQYQRPNCPSGSLKSSKLLRFRLQNCLL